MVKVLVTGANGLIAQSIIGHLYNNEIGVLAISQSEKAFSKISCEFEIVDIRNTAKFEYIADGFNPDYIINCAAISKPDVCESAKEVCWSTNVEAVDKIVQYCAKKNIHLIHFSSDFIFSGLEGLYDESSIPNPVSFYGLSKYESEKLIIDKLTKYTIIRTSLVYGTVEYNLKSNLILWVKNNLELGNPINVVADQFRTPTYDRDIAFAVEKIIFENLSGIYNIAGKDYLSVYDIAVETANFFNLDTSLITPVSTISLNEPAKRPPKTFLLIDKAFRDLDFLPLTLIQGLHDLKKRL